MRVGIVMPAVVQNAESLKLVIDTMKTIRVKGRDGSCEPRTHFSFHLMFNRLNQSVATMQNFMGVGTVGEKGYEPGFITAALAEGNSGPFLIKATNDRERTVSGAWNEGARQAMIAGAEIIIVMASDARPAPGAIDALALFGADGRNSDVAIWSGCEASIDTPDEHETEGCDFSFFAFRPRTLALHGMFDENFKPAYFEDNDYHARVVLGGETARVLHYARYTHVGGGSQTIRNDPEMNHHVQHWWEKNRDYFRRKWGSDPVGTEAEIREKYFKTPFNLPGRSLGLWEIEPDRR